MKSNGVKKGDRVAAYLPNIPETVVAYISTSVLGAIWSSCSPDFVPVACDSNQCLTKKTHFCTGSLNQLGF